MNTGDFFAFVFVIVLFFVLCTHAYAGVIAAPWVPTRRKDYERIVKALGPLTDETIADLGAGGGGVMRTLVRAYPHVKIIGYEISIPAWISAKLLNWVTGLGGRCEIRLKNFYQEDLGKFDVVYCFLTPMAMRKLKDKFAQELKPGARVVSYAFQVPGWEGMALRAPGKVPLFVYPR